MRADPMTRMRRGARSHVAGQAGWAAALALGLVLFQACRPAEDPGGQDVVPREVPPARQTGPEVAHADNPALVVALDRLERENRDVVVVHLRLENRGERPIEVGTAFAFQPEDEGSLSAVFVADQTGSRRYFPLRGADGVPQTSRLEGPLAPGERRDVWVRFGPIPPEVTALAVKVPGFPALPETPLTAGPRASPE
jgi:hypothetical protein